MHELFLLYCCNVALDYSGTGYFSSARKFVTLIMTEVPLLTVGKVFDSIDDAKACVQNYNETKFTNFVVVSNNKKSLIYSCRHAIERKSSSSGQRPNQHYNFVGCAARIRMYKAKNGSVKVTQLDLEHTNHVVDETTHRFNNDSLDEEESDLVRTLKDANTKTSQIKRMLCSRANKRMSTQRVKNLITKLITESSTHADALQECLDSIDSTGGTVKYTYDAEGCVDSLFISSAEMKKKFVEHNPFSIQMDTTFNIEEGKYKLVAFCYLDLTCDRTEVAAFALVSAEGEGNFNFVLTELKGLNQRDDYIFLVDKDFTGIEAVKRTFPGATVLLCVFHVFKFMKTLISTAVTTVEIKKDIFLKFRSLTYCPSQSLYDDLRKDFLNAIKDVQVRCNDTYVNFTRYFEKNWDSCPDMWVKFYRNSLPLLGDHTTNRIERQFWSFKESLSDTFSKTPKTSEAIVHLVKFINDRLQERGIFHNNKRLVIFDTDENIRKLNKDASQVLNERGCILFHKSMISLRDRRDSLAFSDDGVTETFKDNESKLYTCTETSCICIYHKEHRVPCHHILFAREHLNSPIFDADTFDQRYRRDLVHEEMAEEVSVPEITQEDNIPVEFHCDDENIGSEEISLTDNEKYKIVMPILNSIASIVSCHSTKTFLQYVEEFRSVENMIRRGKSILPGNSYSSSSIVPEPESESLSNVPEIHTLHTFPIPPSTMDANPMPLPPEEDQISIIPSSVEPPEQDIIGPSENEELLNQLAGIPNAAPASKFNLKFKKALTSKGRPRKRSKQLASFNKTRHDRKENKEKKTKSKTSATSTKTTTQRTRKVANILNDILNDAGTEEDENFSASELLDGIQGEPLNLPQPIHDILYNPAQQLQSLQPLQQLHPLQPVQPQFGAVDHHESMDVPLDVPLNYAELSGSNGGISTESSSTAFARSFTYSIL